MNATPFTDTLAFDYVVVNSTSPAGPIVINRATTNVAGPIHPIVYKDERGDASTNSITINAFNAGDGTETIDGSPSAIINISYESYTIYNVPSTTTSFIQ